MVLYIVLIRWRPSKMTDEISRKFAAIPVVVYIQWSCTGAFGDCASKISRWFTHWGRDNMDAISQTTFSSAFLWMKMLKFLLRFLWNLFLRVQLTIFQHWFRLWLGAVQATSHYLNQWWLVYWRIYASPGLNELTTLSASHRDIFCVAE